MVLRGTVVGGHEWHFNNLSSQVIITIKRVRFVVSQLFKSASHKLNY